VNRLRFGLPAAVGLAAGGVMRRPTVRRGKRSREFILLAFRMPDPR
jgi:hypothetical protein